MRSQAPWEMRLLAKASKSGSESACSNSGADFSCARRRAVCAMANPNAAVRAFRRVVSMAASARVVQDNLPALPRLVEEQGEDAAGFPARFSGTIQVKSSQHG